MVLLVLSGCFSNFQEECEEDPETHWDQDRCEMGDQDTSINYVAVSCGKDKFMVFTNRSVDGFDLPFFYEIRCAKVYGKLNDKEE